MVGLSELKIGGFENFPSDLTSNIIDSHSHVGEQEDDDTQLQILAQLLPIEASEAPS